MTQTNFDQETGEIFPRKIYNRSNHFTREIGEHNSGISQTIPDQTMPLRTLIERYVRGIPVNEKTPIWDGEDNDLPDIRTMDYAERQEMAQKYAEEYKDIVTAAQQKQAPETPKNDLKIDSPVNTTPNDTNQTNNQQPL